MSDVTQQEIHELFDHISPKYDQFNRFASLGFDGFWRKKTIQGIRPGMRVLDVGTGTGDLAIMAAEFSAFVVGGIWYGPVLFIWRNTIESILG